MTRILILCTGNSCRSQMAEGFLKSFDSQLEIYSAGTQPSSRVHPHAVAVMREVGIDLTHSLSKTVNQFISEFTARRSRNQKHFFGRHGSRELSKCRDDKTSSRI